MSDIPSIVNGAPYVDVWALNLYRGQSFTNVFAQWKAISSKPFYVGEFGVDSYQTGTYQLLGCGLTTKVTGVINEQRQAQADTGLWQELSIYFSALHSNQPVLGGFIHQFNDALWKVGSYHSGLGGLLNYDGPDHIPGTADDDVSYGTYNKEGFVSTGSVLDKVSNEEYYGVVNANRFPKAVYINLRDLFGNTPNLLLNPGFENGDSQWLVARRSVDSTVRHSGLNSIKLTYGAVALSTPAMRIIPNHRYILNGWVKTLNTKGRISVQWFNSLGYIISTNNLSTISALTPNWQFLMATVTAPATAATARIQCQSLGLTVWFDDLQLLP